MKNAIISTSLAIILITLSSPAHSGFIPYGRIFKSAQDERSYRTQAQDSRIQLELRKALLLDSPASLMQVSCYVYLGHGFLIGEVENDEMRDDLIKKAQTVSTLSGISYFLPNKVKTGEDGPSALEIKLKGMLEPDYPSSKVTVKVVQGTVVVLGILNQEEQQQVCSKISEMAGSDKIINFMQIPSPETSKTRRVQPLRRLFN
ncbi:BON domain-containing protein [Maridesulfovibrio sp. FT414]|uniref:BON domain-containing protein n=1 Tax=Maridesulfovibrio sp. FT414 TaxID=2979469 RepID=UPI003D8053E2